MNHPSGVNEVSQVLPPKEAKVPQGIYERSPGQVVQIQLLERILIASQALDFV